MQPLPGALNTTTGTFAFDVQEVQADLHSIMRLEKRSAEYQLAVYVGGGSQYVKHRDALPDDGADPNQRRVSCKNHRCIQFCRHSTALHSMT